jgi:dolichol kinase
MVSAVISIAIFPGNIAFMALSFLAIGDTLAALVGIRFGKRRLRGQKKSLEGSIACFLGTFVFGVIYYICDYELGLSLGTITVGAIGATIAEAWKIRFDDNIKIPLISGSLMYLGTLIFI